MREPSITVGGTWCGHPVACQLELVCENPVRYEGPLELPGAWGTKIQRVCTVRCWPALERSLWAIELPAPEAFDTSSDGRIFVSVQKYEFQEALNELDAKLGSIRAWVDVLLQE